MHSRDRPQVRLPRRQRWDAGRKEIGITKRYGRCSKARLSCESWTSTHRLLGRQRMHLRRACVRCRWLASLIARAPVLACSQEHGLRLSARSKIGNVFRTLFANFCFLYAATFEPAIFGFRIIYAYPLPSLSSVLACATNTSTPSLLSFADIPFLPIRLV